MIAPQLFDVNRDGHITAEEFRAGLRTLGGLSATPITDMQANELMHALDANGDGVISYEEFINGFRLVDERAGGHGRGW